MLIYSTMYSPDPESVHRAQRLEELVRLFGTQKALREYIVSRGYKEPNQGEMSRLANIHKEPASNKRTKADVKTFGYEKARSLCEQIGLPNRWFELPVGSMLVRKDWGKQPAPIEASLSQLIEPATIASVSTLQVEPTLDDAIRVFANKLKFAKKEYKRSIADLLTLLVESPDEFETIASSIKPLLGDKTIAKDVAAETPVEPRAARGT